MNKIWSQLQSWILMTNHSIKVKLIVIFTIMKVIPLVLLAWLAWYQVMELAATMEMQNTAMIDATRGMVEQVGEFIVSDSSKALNIKSREQIEHLTTDTAKVVASFLYDRDRDIKLLAGLPPNQGTYQQFITTLTRPIVEHEPWVLASDGKRWVPATIPSDNSPTLNTKVNDNEKDWHYRKPEILGKAVQRPLYLEITFLDLEGNEKLKVTSSDLLPQELQNVSHKENTWCKAETYFEKLSTLKAGEIYVSDVIGPYVGSPIIGQYTPESAQEKGIEFAPEEAAYAGKENPVGKKFQGLIRWATPVVQDDQIVGYVTMALDHQHLAEFTNQIVPTEERYTAIPDANNGNYAFIWDYKGRSIVHPRHHSIVGYDASTGEPAIPWLEESVYKAWQESGMPLAQFLENTPSFFEPSITKKPAAELTKAGYLGLDGRYLNFAPQCMGWYELTEKGGSGSFLILWSGLWKLTTAATIPYYTGQYGDNSRGFGYVTIGANADEFHRPANEITNHIQWIINNYLKDIDERQQSNSQAVLDTIRRTLHNLTLTTLVMSVVVIIVAIWIATFITLRIKTIIQGIHVFQKGNLDERIQIMSNDEIGALGKAFNVMAESLKNSIINLKDARDRADKVNQVLEQTVEERTCDLKGTNAKLQAEINERKRAEKIIKNLAYHDSLTGLPNRTLFQEKVEEELLRIEKVPAKFAVFFLDLNKFKAINDTYGHEVGDKILCEVAQRLKRVMRNRDIVSRLGGDEFTILATDIESHDDAVCIARKILVTLTPPMLVNGYELSVGASVGISVCPDDGKDLQNLLKKADTAMYKMKKENMECRLEK